jgi:hypothetical protein
LCCNIDMGSQIQNLTKIVESLQQQIVELKNLWQTQQSSTKNDSFAMDEVLHEVDQRRLKERNIVIFNLRENDSEVDDVRSVKEIFDFMDVDVGTNFKAYRLGRNKLDNKSRPVKVTLNSVGQVETILKNSKKLKNYRFKIFVAKDLTARQLTAKNKILEDFCERRSIKKTVRNPTVRSKLLLSKYQGIKY